jgi:transcriptional regulator with XRE-family HTH domain
MNDTHQNTAYAEKPAEDMVETLFGTGLKMRRERLGMTQTDLAQATGLAQTTIAKWEQRANPIMSADNLKLVAQALHTTVRELRAGLLPRSFVNPDTEDSMMVGPYRDLRRIRELDGDRYYVAVTMLTALRKDAEAAASHAKRRTGVRQTTSGTSHYRSAQGSMQGVVDTYDYEDDDQEG